MFDEYNTSESFDKIVTYNAVATFFKDRGADHLEEMGQFVANRYESCANLYDEVFVWLISEIGVDPENSSIRDEEDAVTFAKEFAINGKKKMKYLENVELRDDELECLTNDVRRFFLKADKIRKKHKDDTV